MRNMKFFLLLCLGLSPLVAHAFEVDEFKSGMSRDKVKEALQSYRFDRVQEFSATTLIAYDQPEKGGNRQFIFDFCNDRLVGLQQEMKPVFRNLIVIVNNYNKTLGQPIKVDTSNNITSAGEKDVLAFYWRKGLDLVGLKYIWMQPVEQLMLQYDTSNNCWQIPR